MTFATARRMVLLGLGLVIGGMFILRTDPTTKLLPVLADVPEFQLTDQTGRAVAKRDLLGHPWIASFIYSTCPGPCPLVVQRLTGLAGRLPQDKQVMLVSISVDPERDTPEALAAYAKQHAIEREQWMLLTGDPDTVFQLVRRGFLLSVGAASEMEGNGIPAGEGTFPADTVALDQGPVVHSTRLALVDAAGKIRGYYESLEGPDLERLVADLGNPSLAP